MTGGETDAEEASGVEVHTDMCACVCKPEVISGFPPPHLIIVSQGLSLNLEFDNSAGLAGQ